MNFKGSKKWKKLKEVLYDINKFHPLNVYKYDKSKTLTPIFDLSTKELTENDDINTMKNNNIVYLVDDDGYVELYPKKRGFKMYYSNCVISEEKEFTLKNLTVSSFYKAFKNFKEKKEILFKKFQKGISPTLIEKNIEKDLGEKRVMVTYDDEDGFLIEIINPKNDILTIKNYVEEYVEELKLKFGNINEKYEIISIITNKDLRDVNFW